MNKDDAAKIAREKREQLANPGHIPQAYAKLYSHHVLVSSGAPGVHGFGEQQFVSAIDDAMTLLQLAIVERDAAQSEEWRLGVKRAGELFEWVASTKEAVDSPIPLRLLAAICYWLGGYPAMARGAMKHAPIAPGSEFLASMLRGELLETAELIVRYWRSHVEPEDPLDFTPDSFVRCIGLFVEHLMWGDSMRVENAVRRLRELAPAYSRSTVPFAGIVADAVAVAVEEHKNATLRAAVAPLRRTEAVGKALDRYLKLLFVSGRSMAWPSQRAGLARLAQSGAFLLSTPTGSGKTTIAEVAIIDALLGADDEEGRSAPIAIYVVPSRALAAEVEGRLERTFRFVGRRVRVTGLYGGADWGPADVWMNSDRPVVLVCTFEKAEALIRHLGEWIVSKITLLVIDEFHQVLYSGSTNSNSKDWSEERSLRLESLVTRLKMAFAARGALPSGPRLIALSAVARGADQMLARWVAGSAATDTPVRSQYRSTRQLFGSLTCGNNGAFRIEYALLDRLDVFFSEGKRRSRPYVPNPVDPFPIHFEPLSDTPEARVGSRALWVAMHLAGNPDGHQPPVLVFVPERIEYFAERAIGLIESKWASLTLPTCVMRDLSQQGREALALALRTCEEYYGGSSAEYRLLSKGIVVYHARMPALMQRRFKRLVEDGIARVVVATSTLAEGVNLPVEYVLITSLTRRGKPIPLAEVENLLGRAGRPGVSTEGRVLVLIDASRDPQPSSSKHYKRIVSELGARNAPTEEIQVRSPIGEVISSLWNAWRFVANSADVTAFMGWLEQVDPASERQEFGIEPAVDALDAMVLAAQQEFCEPRGESVTAPRLTIEEAMIALWRASFATVAASAVEDVSLAALQARGRAVMARYADPAERRRIYRSGLPPTSGRKLLDIVDAVIERLKEGFLYAEWGAKQRIEFLSNIIVMFRAVRAFMFNEVLPGRGRIRTPWDEALEWWLDPVGASKTPLGTEVAAWYKFVGDAFAYRACWAMGGVLAVAFDRAGIAEALMLNAESWSRTGLPWIAFWIKELLLWGTHDPVEAFALARGVAESRRDARSMATDYYVANGRTEESLNPMRIRAWFRDKDASDESTATTPTGNDRPGKTQVDPVRPEEEYRELTLRVLPIIRDESVDWIDFAGFIVAASPKVLLPARPLEWEFEFSVEKRQVSWRRYLD